MTEKLLLEGDKVEAAKWLPFARSELRRIKPLGLQRSHLNPTSKVSVRVTFIAGIETIHIKAEAGIRGTFTAIPQDAVSVNGWQEPFVDEFGNLVNEGLGTEIAFSDLIQHRDTVYDVSSKSLASTKARRYPAHKANYPEGPKAGNANWIGPKGEVLSWWGVWGNHLVYTLGIEEYASTLYADAEAFVGFDVHSAGLKRVIKRKVAAGDTAPDYSLDALLGSNVYRNGSILASAPAGAEVTSASLRTDLTGRRWVQIIYGFVDPNYGIPREWLWTAPLNDTDNYKTYNIFTYIAPGSPATSAFTNCTKWAFNASGTEAQVASRQWYDAVDGYGLYQEHRCKLIISEATDPEIDIFPTIEAIQVEVVHDNDHTGTVVQTITQVGTAGGYNTAGTSTKTTVRDSGYIIIGIDYVGNSEVYAGVSLEEAVYDTASAVSGASSVESYTRYTTIRNRERLFFSQNESHTIDLYASDYTRNINLQAGGVSTLLTTNNNTYSAWSYIDPRYEAVVIASETETGNTVQNVSSGGTITNTFSGYTVQSREHLYIGLYNTPHTLYSSDINIPSSVTSGPDEWGSFTDILRGSYASWTHAPAGVTTHSQLNINTWVLEGVGGFAAYRKNGEVIIMTSIPKGLMRRYYTTNTLGWVESWNTGSKDCYNQLISYAVAGSKMVLKQQVDLAAIEPLPNTVSRYMPICVIGAK